MPLITSRVLIGKGEDQGEMSVCVRLILQRASRFLSGHCCLCVYLMLLDVTKKLMNHYIHGAYKLLPHVTVSPRPSPSVFTLLVKQSKNWRQAWERGYFLSLFRLSMSVVNYTTELATAVYCYLLGTRHKLLWNLITFKCVYNIRHCYMPFYE